MKSCGHVTGSCTVSLFSKPITPILLCTDKVYHVKKTPIARVLTDGRSSLPLLRVPAHTSICPILILLKGGNKVQ